MKAIAKFMAAAAAVLALAGCAATAGTGPAKSEDKTITVNASSEVKVVPDKASITVFTVAQGASAEEAQRAGSEAANGVVKRLKEMRIDEKEIQTSWTDLSPVYGTAEEQIEPAIAPDGASATVAWGVGNDIVDYEMRTYIEVGGIDIERVGEVIRASVEAGAAGANGVRYYSSDYDSAYREALIEAIGAARAKAETMARAGGVALGGIVSMNEGYENRSVAYKVADAAYGAAAEEAALDVAPGQIDVSANVTVTYEIL